MIRQLVFTSAPYGLEVGKTGYCTVARHKSLRTLLVRALERFSVFDFQGDAIFSFRQVDISGDLYFVLSRIVDAGSDPTSRSNYLAHHLVLEQPDIAQLPSPSEILLDWNGWHDNWTDPPTYFDEEKGGDLKLGKGSHPLPAETWAKHTGDAANAAVLVSEKVSQPVVLGTSSGWVAGDTLRLFAESSALQKEKHWIQCFTTRFQPTDELRDFHWVALPSALLGQFPSLVSAKSYFDLGAFELSDLEEKIDPELQFFARQGSLPKPGEIEAKASKAPRGINRLFPEADSGSDTSPELAPDLSAFLDESEPAPVPELEPAVSVAPKPKPEPQPLDGRGTNAFFSQEVFRTSGGMICPMCWKEFANKEIKHVAVHPDLMGDDKLGIEEMTRFVPTQFNDDGDPLDDFGVVSPTMACPHCHSQLPQGFTEIPSRIFSLIGAPSSGKTNYLAVLIDHLKKSLFNDFKVSFGDQDPEFNLPINDIVQSLKQATTVRDACLDKTQLYGGGNHQKIFLGEQKVELPKPYVFWLSSLLSEGLDHSIIFYDNAGEHFLPGQNRLEDFHVMHLARAAALFFLFDPVSNHEFRKLLSHDESAPQWQQNYPDNQAVLLSQMNVTIKKALNLSFTRKIDRPLAIIIGKSDLWGHLMPGWDDMQHPVQDGVLNTDVLDENSNKYREFLCEMNPDLVGRAETISSKVRYFAVSSFGHKPMACKDEASGDEMIGPDPHRISPYHVDVPTLWALSQEPGRLIPSTQYANA